MHTFIPKGRGQARSQPAHEHGSRAAGLDAAVQCNMTESSPTRPVQAIFKDVPPHLRLSGPSADDTIRQAAQAGRETPASELPHAERIQESFGRHDVSQIQAHQGPSAAASAQAMHAAAYATGNHVVFAGAPDLHLAAHEAAHVVQQRAGVHLSGGVGRVGDVYEQHADAVAERVVTGQSAEALLDRYAGGALATTGSVQRALATYGDIPPESTYNRWGALYTGLDNASKTRVGTASGRGAAVEGAGVDWHTSVTWGAVKADDGTSMEANPLGPDHPLGYQVNHDSNYVWNKKRKAQEERAGNKQEYRAGHLLNDHLGGPGDDARNLAAIPATANSQHSTKVEQKIKKIVNEEHAWVYYKVTTDQATDNGSTGRPKYTSALHCEWYQLDPAKWQQARPAAGKVAGTDGRVDITIPQPSSYKGGGTGGAVLATVSGAGAAREDRDGAAAWSKVSRKEVVLGDTKALNAQALVMGPINDLLDRMGISEHIESVESSQLTNSLSAIVKATALSAKETEAYKLIEGEKEKLAALAGRGTEQLATYKPPGDLEAALVDAPAERTLRYQTIEAKVKTLYTLVYALPHADTLLTVAKEAWDVEDKPRRETEELCRRLLQTAIELQKQYEESVSVGLSHVAPLRAFYGLDAIDSTTSLHEQVATIKETEVFDWNAFKEVSDLIEPLSPGGQEQLDDEILKSFEHVPRGGGSSHQALQAGYRKNLKLGKGKVYLEKVRVEGEKKRKQPASKFDEQLLGLLEDQADKTAAAKSVVDQFRRKYPHLAAAAWKYLDALEKREYRQGREAVKEIEELYRGSAGKFQGFFEELKASL